MKKFISLFLTFLMCYTVCFGTVNVQASEPLISVSAAVDSSTGTVNISGALTSGTGKIVKVMVYNPNHTRIDFMDDQLIENTDGSFSFSYIIGRKDYGTYEVNVFGPDSGEIASTTFTYAGAGSQTPGPDNKAPFVTISTSSTSYNNPESIIITSDAVDSDGTVAKVEFYANGIKIGEDTAAPYVFKWDSFKADTYSLKAVAYDDKGASSESAAITVTISIGSGETENAAPVISVIASSTSYKTSSDIELNAVASDSDGVVTKVEFYANDVKLGEDTEAPYKLSWEDHDVGTYIVKAVAYDDKGASSQSNLITIKVNHSKSGSSGSTSTPAPSATPTTTPAPSATPTATPAPSATPTPSVTPKPSSIPENTPTQPSKFRDVDESYSWAKDAIDKLSEKGIIKGTGEDTFEPSKNITRADFVVLLVRVLGLKGEVSDNFTDVNSGDYYYSSIGLAKQLGIASGTGDGRFNPEAEISRQDMMVFCVRALEYADKLNASADTSELGKFRDSKEVAGYAAKAAAAMIKAGIIKGEGDMLNPANNATRAETAIIIYRILNIK